MIVFIQCINPIVKFEELDENKDKQVSEQEFLKILKEKFELKDKVDQSTSRDIVKDANENIGPQ